MTEFIIRDHPLSEHHSGVDSISALRKYASQTGTKNVSRLRRQCMNFIQLCSKNHQTKNENPNAKYIMRCTGCISPTALKSTQFTSWQA